MTDAAYFTKNGGYNKMIMSLWKDVESDKIVLRSKDAPFTGTRKDLVAKLLFLHNTQKNQNKQANTAYLGAAISAADCETALKTPRGYASKAGLNAWAGKHAGKWYVKGPRGRIWTDDAIWYKTRNEPCKHGTGKTYDFQPVDFLGSNAHKGWNQSHPKEKAIWGWDPKPGLDHKLYGPHLGYTFSVSGTECIIWVTPAEAFLECIRPYTSAEQKGSVRRRTSAGSNAGVGQWEVT